MAAALRTSGPTRKMVQSFAATAPRLPAAAVAAVPSGTRKLHMTGAKEQSQILTFEGVVAELPRRSETKPPNRHFNTSRSLKAVNDSSTMDFAYMPALEHNPDAESGFISEFNRVPIVPDNHYEYMVSRPADDLHGADQTPVVMPQISVTSLGKEISVMSENHDGGKSADAFGLDPDALSTAAAGEDRGVIKEVWSGFLDDLLGEKTPASSS